MYLIAFQITTDHINNLNKKAQECITHGNSCFLAGSTGSLGL